MVLLEVGNVHHLHGFSPRHSPFSVQLIIPCAGEVELAAESTKINRIAVHNGSSCSLPELWANTIALEVSRTKFYQDRMSLPANRLLAHNLKKSKQESCFGRRDTVDEHELNKRQPTLQYSAADIQV
jgi:hypothetical protein